MNETVSTDASPAPAEELALRQLEHVGAAYALIFVLLLAFVWKSAAATRRLGERIDELERDSHSRR